MRYLITAAACRAGVEVAAEQCDSLAHPDQATAPAALVDLAATATAIAIVADRDHQRVGSVAELDVCAGRARVLDRVCQRLLNDPVGAERAASETSGDSPSIASVTASPVSRTWSSSSGSAASPGCGP